MRELVNQHNHGIQPVITPVVQINANEWVTLELLMAVTGLRKGTILRARDSAWMNGREYKQIDPRRNAKVKTANVSIIFLPSTLGSKTNPYHLRMFNSCP